MSDDSGNSLTAFEAQRLEYSIIGVCVLALLFIFQPFSQLLFSIGCIGVIFGGLIFNLMPMCVAGSSYAKIAKTGLVVAVIFTVVVLLALVSAWMYGVYLRAGG